MTDLAISALSRKRAELAGEIIARAAALDQLRADLAHLDAAIRIMCPDAEPELIRPKKPSRKGCDWFGRQELPRLVLAALRAQSSPCRAPRLRAPSWLQGPACGRRRRSAGSPAWSRARCIGGRAGWWSGWGMGGM